MAAEPNLCPDCIKGVRHEGVSGYTASRWAHRIIFQGTPTGNVENIAGVDVYIAIPPGDYEKDKALLYLPGTV